MGHTATVHVQVTVPAARTLQEPGNRGKEYTAYVAEVELATAGGSYEVLRRFRQGVGFALGAATCHQQAAFVSWCFESSLLQLASGHGRWMLQKLSYPGAVHPGSCTEEVHEVSALPP